MDIKSEMNESSSINLDNESLFISIKQNVILKKENMTS